MPARNSVKEFVSDAYYHVYNRGVEKRVIFMDDQDYGVFLSYVKTYLLPKDTKTLSSILIDPDVPWVKKDQALKLLRMNNFAEEIMLISYCLMPNHFHLLVKQKGERSLDQFMNSLCTRYSMYFNRKHKRVGVLFQDVYKAVRVTSEEQLLHLTRYIHRNPLLQGVPLQRFVHSSYQDYLGLRKTPWITKGVILDYFNKNGQGANLYSAFVEGSDERPDLLRDTAIDIED